MSIPVETVVGRTLRLPGHFPEAVTVEGADSFEGLVILRVRRSSGHLAEAQLSEAELASALAVSPVHTETRIVDPEDLFLLVEAARIRLAYAHDPHFAVSLSGVEPFPHQLEAVYERMLPQVRLRMLLADDPGAGKTIMAGLLIKELKLRGVLDRVLILCPAPLVVQWQDELLSKFDERFEIMRSQVVRDAVAENPWAARPHVIASLDFAKRDDVRDRVLQAPWDLVVIDEAHKCSARRDGPDIARTKRYQLAESLGRLSDRLLLLTATPHQGNPDNFALFLRLLDEDLFSGPLDKELLQLPESPWFLRRQKEDLRDFDGRKLFLPRHVWSEQFTLTDPELGLYRAVTAFINTYLPRGAGSKRQSVALARTVLQRRLASSLGAIRSSLERRHARLEDLLAELDRLPPDGQARLLRERRLVDVDDEQDEGDQDEESADLLAEGAVAAERIEDLRSEVQALVGLVAQAASTQAAGEEAKLTALRTCLERSELAELSDGRGKLLIFTEHRDTMTYLARHLEDWGFSVVTIHGGQGAVERREQQVRFQRDVQICVATEAAGEGINLQFCHLMINYDLPWNPNRLEQRMGRIHRIGQRLDCHIFNFVATNTIEGQILGRLLLKLDEIKKALGDRVFDVVGTLLQLQGLRLEDMLRDAAQSPGKAEDYMDQIESISPDRLGALEKATGLALATTQVDLRRVREEDWRSDERRLMPEYVTEFFMRAARRVGLRVETRRDGLWRVEHVPERFRRPELRAVQRQGPAAQRLPKLTFQKAHLSRPETVDAELLSPGHPLFGALVEVLGEEVAGARHGVARFVDPGARAPYSIHFFEVRVDGETGREGVEEPVYAALAAVVEHDGGFELAPPDVLHDLTPATGRGALADVGDPRRAEMHLRARALQGMVEQRRAARQSEVAIREEYLARAFSAAITAAQGRYSTLLARYLEGEHDVRLARDEAEKRLRELERSRDAKLAALDRLLVVRAGPVSHVATALVEPATAPEVAGLARETEGIELAAMQAVMEHERARGFEPEDVSRLNDGSGFDIRSVGPLAGDGSREVRRIEVKGRAISNQPVMLTPNEWLQARRHGAGYWLYVVWNCAATPMVVPIQDPVAVLGSVVEKLVEVKGFRVPADAISAAGR